MQHDGEHKFTDGAKTAAAAAATSTESDRGRLQRKYPTTAAQLARFHAVNDELTKFRAWQQQLRLSGVTLNQVQQEEYNQRLVTLKRKIDEANTLRMMIHEQRAAKGGAHSPTAAAAVSPKPLFSNGKAAPKPGVAPSRTPTVAELSKRLESKCPTIAEKNARRASLSKEVEALSAWLIKAQAQVATQTEDQKRVVKEKETVLEVKKRDIELLSSLLRDQETKQQQEAEEKEAAVMEDPFAAAEAEEEDGEEEKGAKKKQNAATKAPKEEEKEPLEAEESRVMEVSSTMDESPLAEPSSSPPVTRHPISIVSSTKPKVAPKAAPVVRSKPAASATDSKKRKVVEEEDDVAEPFSPASPASHAMSDDDKDEEWASSKKQKKGGKGASKKGNASGKKKGASKKEPAAKAKGGASSLSKSLGGGRVSAISKARSKPVASLLSSGKNDPFSFDTLREDLMPQRKSSSVIKGKSLLLHAKK